MSSSPSASASEQLLDPDWQFLADLDFAELATTDDDILLQDSELPNQGLLNHELPTPGHLLNTPPMVAFDALEYDNSNGPSAAPTYSNYFAQLNDHT
jgi:hypothetical protein